ncbi:MAG: RND family transporter [Actinobacteria bacterium]|nr:RND family transporter [Actinomycetota bacterium]
MKVFGLLAKMSEKKPWLVIAAAVAITVFMALGTSRIHMDTTNESMVPKDYDSLKALETIEDEFGNVDWQYIIVTADDVTSPRFAKELNDLSIEGAEEAGVAKGHLTAIETYLDGMKKMNGSQGSSSVDYARNPDEGLKKLDMYLSSDYAKNRLFGEVISEDKTATLIKFQLKPEIKEKDQVKLLESFESYLGETFDGKGEKVYISGSAAQSRDNSQLMRDESSKLLLIALGFLILILFMTFRRVSDIALPLFIMMISIIWLFGFMGWIGISYTMMSVMIVPLMLGINIAYVIHLLSRYYEERETGENPYDAVNTSMKTVGVAVFLTALTTVFGFVSFTISDMPPMRDFGILCLLGVVFSFLLAVTMLPAIMVIRDGRKKDEKRREHLEKIKKRKEKAWYGTLIDKILSGSAVASYRYHWFVIASLIIIIGFAVFAGLRLDTDADFSNFLPMKTPSVEASNLIREKFGSRRQDMLLVKGDILDPDNLNALLELEDDIARESLSGANSTNIGREGIISIADIVRDTSKGDLPKTREEINAVLASLEENMQTNSFVNKDGDTTIVIIRTPGGSQNEMKAIAELIRDEASRLESDTGMQAIATGSSIIVTDLLGNILPTQVNSSGLALLLCLLVLVIVFRSALYGMATLTVVVFGVALELIVLYIIGWPLDFFTVTISALVIGVGVDFGIHITHRFREELNHGVPDIADAIKKTVLHVGRSLFAAALTTCGVFAIIGTSQMTPLSRFGITIAISLVGALIGAVIVLPSLLAVVAKVQTRRLSQET